jgi:hypothetical protein
MAVGMKSTIFWDVTPYSLAECTNISGECSSESKSKPSKQQAALHVTAYSLILQMEEAVYSYKISVNFKQTTQCHIIEDR